MSVTPSRDPDAQLAWTEGILIQIARDLELIKDWLGIDRDAEGQLVLTTPAGEDCHCPCHNEWFFTQCPNGCGCGCRR